MSQVTMCAQPENVTITSCKTQQKRPLSIIAEQDCDESDALNYAKCKQISETDFTDETVASTDTVQSNTEAKPEFVQSKLSECKITHTNKKGQNISSKEAAISPESHPSDISSLASISKHDLFQKNSTLKFQPSDSEIESTSFISWLTTSNKENQSNDSNRSKEQAEVMPALMVIELENQSAKKLMYSDSLYPSSKTILNCSDISSDDIQVHNVRSTRHPEGWQDSGLALGEADRLTSLLSSRPSLQSFTCKSPKLGQQLRGQSTGSRLLHDVKDPNGQLIPQITLTSVGVTRLGSLPLTCISNTDDISTCSSKLPIDYLGQHQTNRPFPSFKRSKLNGHLSRLNSAESTGSSLGSELNESSSSSLESPEDVPSTTCLSDFWRLKETTEKLHLSTRRPSTMLWKEQYMEGQGFPGVSSDLNVDVSNDRLTVERKQRIDDALDWLRNELQEMRGQDQNLARQLLTIRQEIHQLKLQRSTEEHQELIEEFQSELDDLQEFSDVLDFPQLVYGNNPLKHIGVTRLNISARRFSAC